jgi:fatty acid desaturase
MATPTLRPVLVHDKSCLDVTEVSAGLRALCRPQPWKAWRAVAGDWLVIAAAITLAKLTPGLWHWPAVLLAAAVIGGRQHALLILMHDAAHGRFLASRKANDLASNMMLAWPCFVSTESYRANHLEHHRNLNTEDDPDWMRKKDDDDWEFPKDLRGIVMIFVRAFFLAEAWVILRAFTQMGKLREKKALEAGKEAAKLTGSLNPGSPWPRLSYYLAFIILFSVTGAWGNFFLYWLLPLLTFGAMFARIRSVCEHFGLAREHDLNHSRNYHANFIERATVAPHYINLHLDHHLFPAIPFYNLAAAHKLLMTLPVYREKSHQSSEIFSSDDRSVLCDLLRGSALPKDARS